MAKCKPKQHNYTRAFLHGVCLGHFAHKRWFSELTVFFMRLFVIGVVVHKLVVTTTLNLQRLKDPVLYCQRLFVVQCTNFIVSIRGTKDLVNSYHNTSVYIPS